MDGSDVFTHLYSEVPRRGAGGPHYIDLHGREWHHGRECWVVKYVLELVGSREIGALGGEVCVGTRS